MPEVVIVILAATATLIIVAAMVPRLIRRSSRPLQVGDRIRISGGYDSPPLWLGGREYVDGSVVQFRTTDPAAKSVSAVVKLDSPITTRGFASDVVMMHLRFVNARWGQHETVHLELVSSPPAAGQEFNGETGYDARDGWIESHAGYRVIAR
ncbi:MAG TPA: hypothetical protein VF824_01895 [Thermoanaerobaculia bacterium]|jgi:hypothetical protein